MPPAAAGLAVPVWAQILFQVGASYVLYRATAPSAPGTKPRSLQITSPSGTAPRRVIYGRVRIGGEIVFMQREYDLSNGSYALHLVVVFAGHQVEELGEVYFDGVALGVDAGTTVTNDRFTGHVVLYKKLGTASQTAVSSGIPAVWTADHRLRGCAYIYFVLEDSTAVFPRGLPNITCQIKGRNQIYDPRDATYKYTVNASLCQADYIAGLPLGIGAPYSRVHEDTLIASANVCDENVPLKGGGFENRYTCNGAFAVDRPKGEILEQLLTASGGSAVFVGGKWFVYPAAWRAPVVTYTDGDAAGPVVIQPRLSRRELFNAVKGLYTAGDNKYRQTDYPTVSNAAYVAEDGGELLYSLDLPFTRTASACQRLAKIALEKVRQQITVDYPAKLTAYRSKVVDVVGLTLPRAGWTAKAFEVGEFGLEQGPRENPTITTRFALRETAAAIYDWDEDTDEQQLDYAPDTELPTVFDDPAPWEDPANLQPTPVNLLWGGDFDDPLSWELTPATGTLADVPANGHSVVAGTWNTPTNAYDGDEGTACTCATDGEIRFTFAAAVKSGRLKLRHSSDIRKVLGGSVILSYSVDGGANWLTWKIYTDHYGTVEDTAPTFFDQQMGNVVVRVAYGETTGAANMSIFECWLEEETFVKPYARIENSLLILCGSGAVVAKAARPVPGPGNSLNTQVLVTELGHLFPWLQVQAHEPPAGDVELYLVDRGTSTEWLIGQVDAADILTDWDAFRWRFTAPAALFGNLWFEIRLLAANPVRIDHAGLFDQETNRWIANIAELHSGFHGDQRTGRVDRFDRGRWEDMPGTVPRRRSRLLASSV